MSPLVILVLICLAVSGLLRLVFLRQSAQFFDVAMYRVVALGWRSVARVCASVSLRWNCLVGLNCLHDAQHRKEDDRSSCERRRSGTSVPKIGFLFTVSP